MKTMYGLKVAKVLLLLLLGGAAAWAQTDVELTKLGDVTYETGAKRLALEQYQEALKTNPANVRANFMAGKCILETIDKATASPFLLKAYQLDPKVSPDVLFLIGQSFQYGLDFPQALSYYQQYKTQLTQEAAKRKTEPSVKVLARIDDKISQCENGARYLQDPLDYTITNLTDAVNSPEADYAPAINKDENLLIFTSRRPGGTGIGNVDKDLEFFEDIYVSEYKDGKWQPAQNIGESINTATHDASISLSADGNQLYLYRDADGTGDIYVSQKRKDGTWGSPEALNENINTSHNESSISLSPDGKTLFFTSDKPGGKGGIDIYVSYLDGRGRWGIAKNLGAPINTKYDEEGAFIDYDGKTLYFSSRGHAGMGGYDIFMSEYDSVAKAWKDPLNIGAPINTADDDIYFVKAGSKFGYYASVKTGGLGDKDIYRVVVPERAKTYETLLNQPLVAKKADALPAVASVKMPKPDKKGPLESIKYTFRVLDGTLPTDAEVSVSAREGGDRATVTRVGKGVYECTFAPQQGGGMAMLSVEKAGYMFRNDPLDVPTATAKVQRLTREVRLGRITTGFTTVLRNIYFHTGKASFKPESYTELAKLEKVMRENAAAQVEIAGHTDRVGGQASNQVLSERRARAVVDYLTRKGIAADRLVAKGYGEDKPLATNDDETEGRELNRRTEFTVTGMEAKPAERVTSKQ